LTRALLRRDIQGDVKKGFSRGFYRVKPKKKKYGCVSIIIPTRASRGLIKICLETLKAKTAYRDYEIICIENIPSDQPEWKTWLRQNADQVIETLRFSAPLKTSVEASSQSIFKLTVCPGCA